MTETTMTDRRQSEEYALEVRLAEIEKIEEHGPRGVAEQERLDWLKQNVAKIQAKHESEDTKAARAKVIAEKVGAALGEPMKLGDNTAWTIKGDGYLVMVCPRKNL